MTIAKSVKFVFKVGVVTAVSVTVLGLIFGGGELKPGLHAMGKYIDAPVADLLMGSRPSIVGVDIRTQVVEREKSWLDMTKAAAAVAAKTAKDATASLEKRNLTRPIDAITANSLIAKAQSAQEPLRAAIFGDQGAKIEAAPEVRDVLALGKKTPTATHAEVASMLATGGALLSASPALKSYALGGLSGPANVAAGSKAFAEMFTVALCAAASDEQAKKWGLPTSDEMKAAGLPARKEAMSRFGIASGGDPIQAALETATKVSRRVAAKASVNAGGQAKPAAEFSSETLAAQAKEHGGAARIFVAEKFGEPSNSPSMIAAKLTTRRAAAAAVPAPVDKQAPAAPFSSLGL